MRKKNVFKLPGIYHDLIIKFIQLKSVRRGVGDNHTLGYYEHEKGQITLGKELTRSVAEHILMHEISHHIVDTLEAIEAEEDRCDVLGSYLVKLVNVKEQIQSMLDSALKK